MLTKIPLFCMNTIIIKVLTYLIPVTRNISKYNTNPEHNFLNSFKLSTLILNGKLVNKRKPLPTTDSGQKRFY